MRLLPLRRVIVHVSLFFCVVKTSHRHRDPVRTTNEVSDFMSSCLTNTLHTRSTALLIVSFVVV